MKPRVFLDVDGVINPLCGKADPDCWDDWRRRRVMGIPVTYSPSVVLFLCELAERADIYWMTTWEDLAKVELAPAIGLPVFEIFDKRPNSERGNWWKLDLVQRAWDEEAKPFVWLDDDIAFDRPAIRWLTTLPNGHFLAISPESDKGLRRDHLILIDEFVEYHSDNQLALADTET